jgi:hypothetical protein
MNIVGPAPKLAVVALTIVGGCRPTRKLRFKYYCHEYNHKTVTRTFFVQCHTIGSGQWLSGGYQPESQNAVGKKNDAAG